MSSTGYCAEIRPEPFLRRVVFASGIVLAAAGIPLLIILPLDLAETLFACHAWCAWCAWELIGLRRGQRACHALRIASDGTVSVQGPGGQWKSGRLLPGSILLRHVGWLRISIGTGRAGGELVRGHCREGQDWRRLQVIWQHVGAVS